MRTIAFFNNKGGAGKTTLVYHLAWMYADMGVSVVAADLDPQANLTAMFLSEDRLEELWPDGDHPKSILGSVSPILRGLGDITDPHIEKVTRDLGLLVGDLGLSWFEAKLSSAWPDCMSRDEAAFRTEAAFHRTILKAADARDAELVLIDVGPNLGAINRSAIIAANHVVFPLAPDLFSLQDLVRLAAAGREAGAQLVIDNLQSGVDFGAKLAREIGAVHVVLSNFPGAMPRTATLIDLLTRNAESLFSAIEPLN